MPWLSAVLNIACCAHLCHAVQVVTMLASLLFSSETCCYVLRANTWL